MNVAQRLFAGSSLRMITLTSGIFLSFFMMPFIIHSIGEYWYGLWVIAASILGFYSLMDLGLSRATQRYVEYAFAQNDTEELNTVFNTSLALFCIIGLIALLATIGIVAAAPLFTDKQESLSTFRIVIFLMGTTLSISFPFYVLNSIISSNIRFDLTSYIHLAKIFIRAGLFVIVLNAGYSIVAMAIVTIIMDSLSNIALAFVCFRIAPWVRIKYRYFSKSRIKILYNFGLYSFLIFMSQKSRYSVPALIIGSLITVDVVTRYNVAMRFCLFFVQAISSVLGVFGPLYTRLYSADDIQRLRSTFLFVTKLATVGSSLLAGVIIIYSGNFLTLWLGQEFSTVWMPLSIMTIGLLFEQIQLPALGVLYAMNKHKFYAIITAAETVMIIGLGFSLVQRFGFNGMAIGISVPIVVTKLLILPAYVCKALDVGLIRYYARMFAILAATVAFQVPLYLIVRNAEPSYVHILASSFIGYAVIAFVALFSIFTRQERYEVTSRLFKGKVS